MGRWHRAGKQSLWHSTNGTIGPGGVRRTSGAQRTFRDRNLGAGDWELKAVSKPSAERGTVPFFLADSEKSGQSPTVLKLLLVEIGRMTVVEPVVGVAQLSAATWPRLRPTRCIGSIWLGCPSGIGLPSFLFPSAQLADWRLAVVSRAGARLPARAWAAGGSRRVWPPSGVFLQGSLCR
jgi:hypothetical protein